MNLGARQPAIPPLGVEPLVLDEDLFLLAMSRALDNTLPSLQSKLQSVIDNVFEQFRLTTPPPALSQPVYYPQRSLEQSSTPISNPKTQIEIVHSHLWKARSKQVALKSTAATEGVKKPHNFRLGAPTLHKTAKYQKCNFRSSAASLLLEDAISAQSNLNPASVCRVSDTGTSILNLNFVSTDCVGVDSVLVAKLNGSDVNFENGEDKSSDKKAKVYSGDVKELSELDGVSVKQDDLQGPNLGENGRECDALHLFDEMSQLYGLCDAGNNIVGYMGIRDKGGGLASHCTFVEYYQLPEKKTATDHLDCKPYVVHNDLGSKEKSASAVAHSEAFTGVHGILELGYCRLNYFGKGILKAEGNVNGISGPALIDNHPREQIQVDDYMVQQLERIRNEWGWSKQEFGENIISAVSLYVRKAGANLTGNKTLILHVPTKSGNSFKLTFSLIIALIELWKYGYVEKNMRWFTGNLVASFINGCLTFQHDYKHISCGIKFNSFLVNGYDERIVFYCFKVLQMMDKWQLYVEVVYKGLSYVIHTSLNLKAVVDLSLCATTECGTVALKVWLSGNLLYLLLGSKLEKLSWFFVVKLEKWEGNAIMMFDKYWERWLSLLVAANECSAGGSLKWFRERDLPLLLLSLSRELANGENPKKLNVVLKEGRLKFKNRTAFDGVWCDLITLCIMIYSAFNDNAGNLLHDDIFGTMGSVVSSLVDMCAQCGTLKNAYNMYNCARAISLNWLVQLELEQRNWTAAIFPAIISSFLQVTDHKQLEFGNMARLVEVMCSSESNHQRRVCRVGLSFSCQDMLTSADVGDNSSMEMDLEKMAAGDFLGDIAKVLGMMFWHYFSSIRYDIDTSITAELSNENCDYSLKDIWGIARLDFGLMNYVGAMCRDGVHDTISKIKDVMILWVLHVNGMVQGSFHHLRWELMKKGWQLQLFLPRVITHEMGEAFTTWELILARGGYSNWECSGTQGNEGDDRLVVDNEDVRAVVLHNDGLMIVEDDIADGDKESNISLLQHIFVHLQGLAITDLKLLIIQQYLSSYTFLLALGLICVSTCSRYISADTANRRGFQMTSCKGAQILIQNVKLEDKFV